MNASGHPGEDAPSRLRAVYDAAYRDCRPLSVLWEVTYNCNLRCRHCYVECDEAPTLSVDESARVLDELARAGVLTLVFTGGEVFARPDFLDILRAAREREFAFRVLTNGTLLGDGEADALAELAPLSVDFSLYGEAETHDRITGVAGSCGRTREAVDRVLARGMRVRIKTPLMKSNRGELAKVRDLAESLGATLVTDVSLVCRPSGDRSPLAEELPERDVLELAREFYEGRAVARGGNLEPGEPFCSAGRSVARVTPSGNLTPCIAIPAAAGSLREKSFDELWRSPLFERMRAMRLDDLAECRSCAIREWCVRCPGQALVEDGDIAAPSSAACRMARVFAALATGKAAAASPGGTVTEARG